jgi:hypothetical protein
MLRLCGSCEWILKQQKGPFPGLHEERMMGLEPTI